MKEKKTRKSVILSHYYTKKNVKINYIINVVFMYFFFIHTVRVCYRASFKLDVLKENINTNTPR